MTTGPRAVNFEGLIFWPVAFRSSKSGARSPAFKAEPVTPDLPTARSPAHTLAIGSAAPFSGLIRPRSSRTRGARNTGSRSVSAVNAVCRAAPTGDQGHGIGERRKRRGRERHLPDALGIAIHREADEVA